MKSYLSCFILFTTDDNFAVLEESDVNYNRAEFFIIQMMGNTNGVVPKMGGGKQLVTSCNVHVFYMDWQPKHFIVKVIIVNRGEQRIFATPKDGQQRDEDLNELGRG